MHLLVNAIVFREEVESGGSGGGGGVYVAAAAIVSRAHAPHTGYGISTRVPYVAMATATSHEFRVMPHALFTPRRR